MPFEPQGLLGDHVLLAATVRVYIDSLYLLLLLVLLVARPNRHRRGAGGGYSAQYLVDGIQGPDRQGAGRGRHILLVGTACTGRRFVLGIKLAEKVVSAAAIGIGASRAVAFGRRLRRDGAAAATAAASTAAPIADGRSVLMMQGGRRLGRAMSCRNRGRCPHVVLLVLVASVEGLLPGGCVAGQYLLGILLGHQLTVSRELWGWDVQQVRGGCKR